MKSEVRQVELEYANWKVLVTGDYTPPSEGEAGEFNAFEVIGTSSDIEILPNIVHLLKALDVLETIEIECYERLVAEGS